MMNNTLDCMGVEKSPKSRMTDNTTWIWHVIMYFVIFFFPMFSLFKLVWWSPYQVMMELGMIWHCKPIIGGNHKYWPCVLFAFLVADLDAMLEGKELYSPNNFFLMIWTHHLQKAFLNIFCSTFWSVLEVKQLRDTTTQRTGSSHCPTGWVKFGERCFSYYPGSMDWVSAEVCSTGLNSAQAYCPHTACIMKKFKYSSLYGTRETSAETKESRDCIEQKDRQVKSETTLWIHFISIQNKH